MDATIEEAVMVLRTIRIDKEKIIENEKKVITEVFGKAVRKWFDKNKDINRDALCQVEEVNLNPDAHSPMRLPYVKFSYLCNGESVRRECIPIKVLQNYEDEETI
jgi:hypothetical protein